MVETEKNSAKFQISALHCSDEFSLIEKGLREVDGIRDLAPNYVQHTLRVVFDAEKLDSDQIANQLHRIGFPAHLAVATAKEQPVTVATRFPLSALVGGGLLVCAAIVFLAFGNTNALVLLAVLSTIFSGWPVSIAAIRAVRLKRLDMNALMTIAATGALAAAPTTGEWLEAPTAMFLFAISVWLEAFSVGRARKAVQTLVELSPIIAHRINNDVSLDSPVNDVDVDQVAVGEFVLVKPGERIPIDGQIESGESTVNQAPITGEAMPIEKGVGDHVYAGSLNGEGVIQVRATKVANESTLAHIARLVEQAQSSRSSTERFVDQFARRYTPAVIALAILIVFVPPTLARMELWSLDPSWTTWFHRGLVLLVIACPCALVLSTPITIVCGLHRATRFGILVKGGEHLESAADIECLAIDKTGTLTVGSPSVERIVACGGITENHILSIAASLESGSEHPLAAAILREASEHNLIVKQATQVQAIRGFGVEGMIDDQQYMVGNRRLFEERHIGTETIADNSNQLTVAFVGTPERTIGAVLFSDEFRDEAQTAIDELRALGIQQIVMLTGDHRESAQHIATQLGIDRFNADLLSADKIEQVRKLREEFDNTAMVGDGVNDAPALATAKVGIALGSQSSDTALETADIVVMSPDLGRLPILIRLARRTRGILWQNIGVAIGIKLIVLTLAAAGLATMWMAVAADVGASLLVIFNGMRLLHVGAE